MAKLEHTVDAARFNTFAAETKGLYIQQGDKYVLDVDTTAISSALETERQARKALETKLAGYGEMTPDQVKALAEQKSKAEREKDFANGNFEKILAEERAKHGKDLELRDKGEARLKASLESALIGEEATRAVVAEGGNPDLLLPIIRAITKLEAVGDRFVAVVIGEKGGPLLKAGAQKADDYMPLAEFVKGMKADKRYAGAFASLAGSGTGGKRTETSPTRIAEAADRNARMERVVAQLKEAQASGQIARVSE